MKAPRYTPPFLPAYIIMGFILGVMFGMYTVTKQVASMCNKDHSIKLHGEEYTCRHLTNDIK